MNHKDNIRIVFPSSFFYPSHPALWRFGLEQARGLSHVLKENFLFIVERALDMGAVEGIQYVETHPARILRLRQSHLLTVFNFFWLLVFFIKNRKWRKAVVYAPERNIGIALLVLRKIFRFSYKVIFECHGHEWRWVDRYVYHEADYVNFITHHLKKIAVENGALARGHPSGVLSTAVNMHKFKDAEDDVAVLRGKCGLPLDKRIIMHVGRFKVFGRDKGIFNLIDLLTHLKKEDVVACMVGGTKAEIIEASDYARRRNVLDRCIFVEFVNEWDVVSYMKAADILVYIPPPTNFFLYETSPNKLFEYMAARRPIAVADYPGFREILSDETALFVRVNDLRGAANALSGLLDDGPAKKTLADRAYEKVKENTWEKRAEHLVAVARRISGVSGQHVPAPTVR